MYGYEITVGKKRGRVVKAVKGIEEVAVKMDEGLGVDRHDAIE